MAAAKVKNRTMMKRLSASVSELLGGRKAKEGLEEGMESLRHAVFLGNVQLIRLILQTPGLSLEAVDNKGRGALHWAAGSNREVVETLLQNHLDPDIKDSDGNTPLHLMAREGNADGCVEVLLSSDSAALFLQPNQGGSEPPATTGLHLAARNGHLDVLHVLLNRGMDVNEWTPTGTAIHEAARHCQLPAARLLLFMGADAEAKNQAGLRSTDLLSKYSGKHLATAKDINALLKMSGGSVYAEAIVANFGTGPDELSFPAGATIWVLEQEGRKRSEAWQGVILGPKGTTRAGYFPPTSVKLTSSGRGTMQRGPQRTAKKVSLPALPSELPPQTPTLSRAATDSTGVSYSVEENPDLKQSLQEAKAVSSGHAGMLAAVRSPRHRASTGSNYSHSSSSGFESLKGGGGRGSKCSAQTPSVRGPSPSHSQSRHSLHSGSSSSGTADSLESGISLERLDESGYASQANIAEMITNGVPDEEVMGSWLAELRMEEYLPLFTAAGYDLPSLARMTPEDLTAIGISRPPHRKRLTNEIHRLNVGDPWPGSEPAGGLSAWLSALNLPPEYFNLFQKEGFHTLAQGPLSPRIGARVPSPGMSTFANGGGPGSFSPQHSRNGPGYETFPRRGWTGVVGQEVVTTAQIHDHERPIGSVRPQPSHPSHPTTGGGSLQRPKRSTSLEKEGEECHYANLPGLVPASPRIRLNLHSPARKLSEPGARKPPPPPPKRSPVADQEMGKANGTLFPDARLDLSAESVLSAAPSLDCLPPPVIRCEESMRNLRALVSRRASEEPSSSTETLPFANDNCGTIRNRHSPGGQRGQNGKDPELLTDLGDMLQNLTDELDALLVPAT